MTWEQIVELAKNKPREVAFAMIDQWVAHNPELAEAGNRAKAFLDQLYAVAALDPKIASAMEEIWNLIQTGEGPVSSAPEIGLV